MKKKIKKTKLQCFQCLPPKPLNGHPSLYGILFHSRVDCPENMVYMINEKDVKKLV